MKKIVILIFTSLLIGLISYYYIRNKSGTKGIDDMNFMVSLENENAYSEYNCGDIDQNEIVEAANNLQKKQEEQRKEQVELEEMQKQKNIINFEKLYDFDYLCQKFYQIDNTTTINSEQLNVDKLSGMDMSIDESIDGPNILIYHTHSQEGYVDSIPNDSSTTVVGVGEYLTKLLEEDGFRVIHHTGEYDVGDRDHAYSKAAPALEQILSDNPSIQVVIDLHRDGISENTHLYTEIDGRPTAKIMFFNGLCRTTTKGDLTNLANPYLDSDLAMSFQLQLSAAEKYPDLTRRIYLKGYRYNMHMCPKSILVEVGAQTNTVEEAMNAMIPLEDILSDVLR